jgi:hypothetical protein
MRYYTDEIQNVKLRPNINKDILKKLLLIRLGYYPYILFSKFDPKKIQRIIDHEGAYNIKGVFFINNTFDTDLDKNHNTTRVKKQNKKNKNKKELVSQFLEPKKISYRTVLKNGNSNKDALEKYSHKSYLLNTKLSISVLKKNKKNNYKIFTELII